MAQVADRTASVRLRISGTLSSTEEQWNESTHQHRNGNWKKQLPNTPPTLPPKDIASTLQTPIPEQAPSSAMASNTDLTSYFRPGGLSRAGSVYSISRISFTSQISQLTAIHLPDCTSLKDSISAIATSKAAAKTLTEAADQIQLWIQKASDVLAGLDAGDDAEWAAAAGREGLAEIDQAIVRFQGLIEVYVSAVEGLQLRDDASYVPGEEMNDIVTKVEKVTLDWKRVKKSFADVKYQVELAMEWEELGSTVLEEIAVEIEGLSRLIFELEERRHHSSNEFLSDQDQRLDLEELETVMHEAPQTPTEISILSERFNVASDVPSYSFQSPALPNASEESSVLGLFARMEPLRAFLDFLPMRLSPFKGRAKEIFPFACEQLEERRENLEDQWKQLEGDADCLRRELREDRWNLVFRNAGKQALKLIDSVERSLTKVDESLGNDTHLKHSLSTFKKIENYEAKKVHYCPAIDRVLSIVERGIKDRLTMNGEIIRLRADVRQKWQSLQEAMKHMDTLLDEYAAGQSANQHQLRDSLSSIMSHDRSLEDSVLLTPGSSPPSSVVSTSSQKGGPHQSPNIRFRRRSENSHEAFGSSAREVRTSGTTTTGQTRAPETIPGRVRRDSNLPLPTHKMPVARSSAVDSRHSSAPINSSTPNSNRSTPRISNEPRRPRWNYSKQSGADYDVSQYYASLKAKTATSARKVYSRQQSLSDSTPVSSPLSSRASLGANVTSRPLSRKISDLSMSAETRPGRRTTPNAYLPPLSRDQSPLIVRKRSNNYSQQSPLSPSSYDPSSPQLNPSSPALNPTSKITPGNPHVAGSRGTSMIPVPGARVRASSAVRTTHPSDDVGPDRIAL